MSSMNIITNESKNYMKTPFIKPIKVDGTLVKPNDITKNSYYL